METEFTRKERNLSGAETVIMKAIWDHTGDGKKLSVPELITLLNEEYGRPYAKTTVVTFLLHLSDKRFVTTYREGRYSYVQPTKTEQQHKNTAVYRQHIHTAIYRQYIHIQTECERKIPKHSVFLLYFAFLMASLASSSASSL